MSAGVYQSDVLSSAERPWERLAACLCNPTATQVPRGLEMSTGCWAGGFSEQPVNRSRSCGTKPERTLLLQVSSRVIALPSVRTRTGETRHDSVNRGFRTSPWWVVQRSLATEFWEPKRPEVLEDLMDEQSYSLFICLSRTSSGRVVATLELLQNSSRRSSPPASLVCMLPPSVTATQSPLAASACARTLCLISGCNSIFHLERFSIGVLSPHGSRSLA